MMSFFGLARAEMFNKADLKGAVCGQCHDNDGISNNSTLPSLNGQDTDYLIQQINSFLKGDRNHPILVPSNKTSNTQITSVAKYYSNLEVKNADLEPIHITPSGLLTHSYSELIKQGESIYAPCAGCHGLEAEGIAPYPRLAGQQNDYLKQQLIHFKTGKRNNNIMQMMTVNLSDEDINALAIYLSTLNNMNLQARDTSQD